MKHSCFEEQDAAYKCGQKDKKAGKLLLDNPYPRIKPGTRSQTPFGSWIRGWLSVPANPKIVRCGGNKASPYLTQVMSRLNWMKGWHGKDLRCLDVGCGRGRNSILMKNHEFEVVSLDLKPDYGMQWDLNQGCLPVFSSSIDVILLQYVLMFIPKDAMMGIIDASCEALKPMGCAIIEFYPAKESFYPTQAKAQEACREAVNRVTLKHGLFIYFVEPLRFVASKAHIPTLNAPA